MFGRDVLNKYGPLRLKTPLAHAGPAPDARLMSAYRIPMEDQEPQHPWHMTGGLQCWEDSLWCASTEGSTLFCAVRTHPCARCGTLLPQDLHSLLGVLLVLLLLGLFLGFNRLLFHVNRCAQTATWLFRIALTSTLSQAKKLRRTCASLKPSYWTCFVLLAGLEACSANEFATATTMSSWTASNVVGHDQHARMSRANHLKADGTCPEPMQPHKPFLYLLLLPGVNVWPNGTFDLANWPPTSDRRDVIVATFRLRSDHPDVLWLPNTSWTRARNAMLREGVQRAAAAMRDGGYLYYTLADGDAGVDPPQQSVWGTTDPWEVWERSLLWWSPAAAMPANTVHDTMRSTGIRTYARALSTSPMDWGLNGDAIINAYHRTAIFTVLPYDERLDSRTRAAHTLPQACSMPTLPHRVPTHLQRVGGTRSGASARCRP